MDSIVLGLRLITVGIILVLLQPRAGIATSLQPPMPTEEAAAHNDGGSGHKQDKDPDEVPLKITVFGPPNPTYEQQYRSWFERMNREYAKVSSFASQIDETCEMVFNLTLEDSHGSDVRKEIDQRLDELNSKIARYKKVISNARRLYYKTEFAGTGGKLQSLVDSIPSILEQKLASINENYKALNKEEGFITLTACWFDFDTEIFFFEGDITINEAIVAVQDTSLPNTLLRLAVIDTNKAILEWMKWEEKEHSVDKMRSASEVATRMLNHLDTAAEHVKDLRDANKAQRKKDRMKGNFSDEVYEMFTEMRKSYEASYDIEKSMIKEYRKIAKVISKVGARKADEDRTWDRYVKLVQIAQADLEQLNTARNMEILKRSRIPQLYLD